MELENLENLVNLTVSTEKGLFLYQFSEDTANCPNINSKTVLFLSKQNFRSTIPESLNLMSEGFNGKRESTSESEICDFESASSVNEKILRLKISMDDSPGMAVMASIAKLVQEQRDWI